MQKDTGRYSGYDIVVVFVGANDLGRLDMTNTVEDLHELLCILQEANPRAAVYGCEVCTYLFKLNLNLSQRIRFQCVGS